MSNYIKEIQYLLDEQGISDDQLPEDENAGQVHNALADAKYIMQLWNYALSLKKGK